MIGKTLSHFRILEKLGEGGMGVAYKALDTKLGRVVTVKMLSPRLSASTEHRDRLLREAKAAATLNHPNICTIYEVEQVDDQLFLVMEYVEGRTLRDEISQAKAEDRNWKRAMDVACQLADALWQAHRKGVIHRDIKPSNIMLKSDGRPKILDFGLARVEQTLETASLDSITTQEQMSIRRSGMAGTIGYMSPEQIRAEEVDHRADIFALGVVLYELFAGKHPFDRGDPILTSGAVLSAEPEPFGMPGSSMPDQLQQIVFKCLKKQREERYQSAGRLLLDLRSARRKRKKSSEAAPSIAVLPFANLSGNSADEYLSDGITSEIILKLARMKHLLVISRTSTMRYKDSRLDVRQIGNELGVQAILEGGFRKYGDRCRITAELVSVKDGFHLWAEGYDSALEDIFEVQDWVSTEIARALNVQLSPDEVARISQASTTNLAAFQDFLRGRQLYFTFDDAENRAAIRAFRRALSRDPRYAQAYAGLAFACIARVEREWEDDEKKWMKRALKFCRSAIRFNPSIAEAYAARGLIYFRGRQFSRAERAIRRALQLNTNNEIAHNLLGRIHFQRGEFRRAGRAFHRAVRLSPSYVWCWNDLAWVHWLLGDFRQVRAIIDRVLAINPSDEGAWMGLAMHHYLANHLDDALNAIRKSIQANPNYPFSRSVLAMILARKGLYEEAERICREAIAADGRDILSHATLGLVLVEKKDKENARRVNDAVLRMEFLYAPLNLNMAIYYSFLGEVEWAGKWLRKAFAEGVENKQVLRRNPFLRQFAGQFEQLPSEPKTKEEKAG